MGPGLIGQAAGALGAGLLPAAVIPYLGVLPLGIRVAWRLRRDSDDGEPGGTGTARQCSPSPL